MINNWLKSIKVYYIQYFSIIKLHKIKILMSIMVYNILQNLGFFEVFF